MGELDERSEGANVVIRPDAQIFWAGTSIGENRGGLDNGETWSTGDDTTICDITKC